jgi:membrane protease YdiL (CAAX protease family)/uncharacterized RDD family membrane protein YckC
VSVEEFTAPAPAGARPVEYASFARRLGAALLDSLVWIIGLTFFNPAPAIRDNEAVATIVGLLILSAWFNYFAFCEWRWGQTIGKNATGIRVLPLEGGRLTWQAAALRNLLRLVDLPLALVGADYLIVRRSPRCQRLGDRAAKTIVVRERQAAETARPPQRAAPAGPTAAELFGEAAEVLGRQPAAGSVPSQSAGRAGNPAPSLTGPAEQPELAAASLAGPQAPPADQRRGGQRVASWTAAGFPYATWDVRRTVLGVAAGLLVGGLFAPLLVVPFDPDLDSTPALLVAQALLAATLIFVSIGVATGAAPAAPVGRGLSLLGLRRFRPSAFGWLALAAFAYFTFVALYASLITQPNQEDIARDLGLHAGVLAAIPVVVLIAIVAPIAEELFFRGMLFGGLRGRLSTYPAAAISAAVFGGLHATTGVTAVPPLIVFGFLLALLYERTGSLVPGMIAHALNNALALAVS